MKNRTLTAIAIAAILIVAGVALAAVAFEMGGGPRELLGSITDSRSQDVSGNIASWSNGDEYGARVDSIVVNWTSGRVIIEGADVNEVSFSESAESELTQEQRLYYCIEKGTLYIYYLHKDNTFGIFGDDFTVPAKQLKITVPLEMAGISADTTSAEVEIRGVELERLSLDTTSGNICAKEIGAVRAELGSTSGDISFDGGAREFEAVSTSGKIIFNGSVGEFSADSTSGDISFEGSAKGFSADTTSGSVYADFTLLPTELEAETVSGNVELAFPGDSGFALEFDTVSGEMESDFAFRLHDGEYIAGRGGAEISVSTVSGNCTVNEH